jgi:AcrR family transcriptional regulator
MVRPAMVRTPWGDTSELRARRMRPGQGTPREYAERNQRERLFAALVATVAEKGYAATTVADMVELSGVSRSAFYRHFDDKQSCFLAAIGDLVGPTLERVSKEIESAGDEAAVRDVFGSLIELIVSQPAAAKMCFVEVYAAGPAGAALVDRTLDAVEELVASTLSQLPGRNDMPSEIIRAIIGGVQKVIYKRLLRNEEEQLRDLVAPLWEWVISYPSPPGPLRPTRRRSVEPLPFAERQALAKPAERVLRALAAVVSEKGYQDATVAEIVDRASTSQRTFYEHFSNKEDAMVAALDSGSSQMLAAALPAFRRAGEWRQAVHDTQEAMFHFAAEEPEYGRLGAVEMYAAGTRALEQREMVTEGMEGLLAPGYELAPDTSTIAAEAIGGALYALLYDFVAEKGPERLLELVPTAVYVTLAPFLGAEEAYEVAVA